MRRITIRRVGLVSALLAAVLTAGCASPTRSGYGYTDAEARRPMLVQMATVEAVREVTLEQDRQTGAGTAAGAVVGGIAGSTIGGGRGSAIAAVLGAVAGGVAGSYGEKGLGKRAGLEITVKTDDGRTMALVQEAAGEQFSVGQRVRVLTDTGRGVMRVAQ